MKMNKIIENAYKAHFMELLLMPALLYTYDLNDFAYWIVLILFDQYILQHENILEVMLIIQEGSYKKEMKKIVILEICMMICLVITFIKNWRVGMIYVVNDLVLMLAEAASYGKEKNKK